MALVPFPGPQSGAVQIPPDEDDELPGGKMSFLEHLDELRKRIVRACLAVAGGVLVGFFFIMYQVWMFIAPGLYSNEKKFAIPFVLFSTLGFLAGAAFNHYVAFPFIMIFFASFNSIDLKFMPKLEDVFGLYTKMLIGIGIVFQLPTVIYFLAKMRLVTARFLARNFKYALLLTFIVAAVITPTGDPMTQTIFAAPMIALYGLSIIVAWLVGPKHVKESV